MAQRAGKIADMQREVDGTTAKHERTMIARKKELGKAAKIAQSETKAWIADKEAEAHALSAEERAQRSELSTAFQAQLSATDNEDDRKALKSKYEADTAGLNATIEAKEAAVRKQLAERQSAAGMAAYTDIVKSRLLSRLADTAERHQRLVGTMRQDCLQECAAITGAWKTRAEAWIAKSHSLLQKKAEQEAVEASRQVNVASGK